MPHKLGATAATGPSRYHGYLCLNKRHGRITSGVSCSTALAEIPRLVAFISSCSGRPMLIEAKIMVHIKGHGRSHCEALGGRVRVAMCFSSAVSRLAAVTHPWQQCTWQMISYVGWNPFSISTPAVHALKALSPRAGDGNAVCDHAGNIV